MPRWRSAPSDVELEILDYIRDTPGCTRPELATATGLSFSTITYHVECLEELGRVVVHRERGRSSCWLPGTRSREGFAPLLRDASCAAILDYVRRRPAANLHDLAVHLDCSNPTVKWHLNRLVRAGMVELYKVGRNVRVRILVDLP